MARKQDTETRKKLGIVGRIMRAAARRVLAPIIRIGEKATKAVEKAAPKPTKKMKGKAKTRTPRDVAEPGVRHLPERTRGRVEPIETTERHGAGRDERSFEQRRRGGPMTGAAPAKAEGPRHAGGGKRRGRDNTTSEILDDMGPLPIVDYDELSAEQIKQRLDDLRPADLERLMRYERATKHRKSIVSLLEKRLAA